MLKSKASLIYNYYNLYKTFEEQNLQIFIGFSSDECMSAAAFRGCGYGNSSGDRESW